MRELHSGLVKYSETVVAGPRSTPFQSQPAGKSECERLEKDSETPRGDVCWPASTWLCCEHLQISWESRFISRSFSQLCLSMILTEPCCTFCSWEITVYPGLNLRLPPLYLWHFLFSQLSFCLTQFTPVSISFHFCITFSASLSFLLILWLASLQFIFL